MGFEYPITTHLQKQEAANFYASSFLVCLWTDGRFDISVRMDL